MPRPSPSTAAGGAGAAALAEDVAREELEVRGSCGMGTLLPACTYSCGMLP